MRSPLHPLEEALRARIRLLATTLRPATVRQYEHTVRLFMAYLRARFPDLRSAHQLRRDPHVLGWLEYLWTRRVSYSGKPLSTGSRAGDLMRLSQALRPACRSCLSATAGVAGERGHPTSR